MSYSIWDKQPELVLPKIPFELFAGLADKAEKRMDADLGDIATVQTTLGKLKAASFDTEHRDEVQKEYNNDAIRIAGLLEAGDPNAHKELIKLKSKITMDPRLTLLQNNYDKEVLYQKDKGDMLKDKNDPYRYWNDPLLPFLKERKDNNNPLTPFNYTGILAHSDPSVDAARIVGGIADTQLTKEGWRKDPSDPTRYLNTKGEDGIIDDQRFKNIIEASIPQFIDSPGGRSKMRELQYAYNISDPKQVENELRTYLRNTAYKQLHIKGGGETMGGALAGAEDNAFGSSAINEAPLMKTEGIGGVDNSFFNLIPAGTFQTKFTPEELAAIKREYNFSEPGDRAAFAARVSAGKTTTKPGYNDLSKLSAEKQQLVGNMAKTLSNVDDYKDIATKFLNDPNSLTFEEKGKLYKGFQVINSALGKTSLRNTLVLPVQAKDERRYVNELISDASSPTITTSKLGTGNAVNTKVTDENGREMTFNDFLVEARKLDPDGSSLVTISGKLNGTNAVSLVTGNRNYSNGYQLSIKGHPFYITGPEMHRTDTPRGLELEQNRVKNDYVAQINSAVLSPVLTKTIDYFGTPVEISYDDKKGTFIIQSYDGKKDIPTNVLRANETLQYNSAEEVEDALFNISKKLGK